MGTVAISKEINDPRKGVEGVTCLAYALLEVDKGLYPNSLLCLDVHILTFTPQYKAHLSCFLRNFCSIWLF